MLPEGSGQYVQLWTVELVFRLLVCRLECASCAHRLSNLCWCQLLVLMTFTRSCGTVEAWSNEYQLVKVDVPSLGLQFECTEDGPPAPLMMSDGTSGCETDRLKRELGTRFGYADFKSKLQERAVVAINGGMYNS